LDGPHTRRVPDLRARSGELAPRIDRDPYCLGQLKHYRSLLPLAYEARKPIFRLTPADRAFGGHQAAVAAASRDFSDLADRLLSEVVAVRPGGEPSR